MHSFTLTGKLLKYILIVLISLFIFWLGYLAKEKKVFPIKKFFSSENVDAWKSNFSNGSKPLKLYGNDFILDFLPYQKDLYKKTAGIFSTDQDGIQVLEQSKAQEILIKYSVNLKDADASSTLSHNGGLKKFFQYKHSLFGLFALQSTKDANCLYASLINLSTQKEVFKAPCLPDKANVDFNAIGGGHAQLHGQLLLAIGTPTTDTKQIADLAQNLKSPYGKILEFSDVQLFNTKDQAITQFKIYSLGHRNPQGLINLDGHIYEVEQGPKGGDEINLIKQGKNYGWPLYTLGSKYNGSAYKASGNLSQFEPPLFSFVPSVAASNIIECPENIRARYKPLSCVLVSSLRGKSIFLTLIEPTSQKVISMEKIEVGTRLREFFLDQATNDLYVTSDEGPMFKIVFRDIPEFVQ